MDGQLLLTPEEVAEIFRVAPQEVIALIEEGAIGGLQIGNQWRITTESVTQYLSDGLRAENLKALKKNLEDRTFWANMLEKIPSLRNKIENENYNPGTMGRFLQESLIVKEEIKTGNVVQFAHTTDESDDP